jgi:hypothetical protein
MYQILPLASQLSLLPPEEQILLHPQLGKVLPEKAELRDLPLKGHLHFGVHIGDLAEGASRGGIKLLKGLQGLLQLRGTPSCHAADLLKLALFQKIRIFFQKL